VEEEKSAYPSGIHDRFNPFDGDSMLGRSRFSFGGESILHASVNFGEEMRRDAGGDGSGGGGREAGGDEIGDGVAGES